MSLEGFMKDLIGGRQMCLHLSASWRERDGKLKVLIKENLMKGLFTEDVRVMDTNKEK